MSKKIKVDPKKVKKEELQGIFSSSLVVVTSFVIIALT